MWISWSDIIVGIQSFQCTNPSCKVNLGRWQNVFDKINARVTLLRFHQACYFVASRSGRQCGEWLQNVREIVQEHVIHHRRKGCTQQHGLQGVFQWVNATHITCHRLRDRGSRRCGLWIPVRSLGVTNVHLWHVYN